MSLTAFTTPTNPATGPAAAPALASPWSSSWWKPTAGVCGWRASLRHRRDLCYCAPLDHRDNGITAVLRLAPVEIAAIAIWQQWLVCVQYIKGYLYIMLNTLHERKTICADNRDPLDLALAAQEHLLDGVTATRAAELFATLSDPRVRIVGLLAHTELCVGDLCLVLGMSQPAVSHHLRLLRTMRLVTARKDGKHVFYSLLDDHIHQLFHQGVDHIQHG